MADHNSSHRSALITGASSGIGLAIARFLAERDWQVFAGVRKQADADRLEALDPANIHPLFLDVTQPEMIQAAVDQIRNRADHSGLDGLVNNAGIAVNGPMEFLSLQDLRDQFEVNFFGQIAVSQAALPLLRNNKGRIVNISSISGRVAMPFFGPYASSKFALEAFSDSLRLELRPWGIHVALVEPGAVETPIWDKSLQAADKRIERLPRAAHVLYGQDIRRIREKTAATGNHGVPAQQVAKAVFHALTARRPRIRYPVGRGIRAAIILIRLAPDRWRDWLVARLTGFDREPGGEK